MKLIYVTGNQEKINACKNIFRDSNIEIQEVKLDIPEIQGDSKTVAIEKAKRAFAILNKPLIINDSSLMIDALNDFPGVYASFIEKTLGSMGILKLLEGEKNRNCYYLDILIYIDKYGYKIFEDKTYGTISLSEVDSKYPYDRIFIKDGMTYPIGYYKDKINSIYQNNTYKELLTFLNKRHVARGITFFDNKVLLLKRRRLENGNYLNYYSIPGGGVELDESYEDACIRELSEECSIKVKINKYLDFDEYSAGVCYYFLTDYLSGKIELGGEEKENNRDDNHYEVVLFDINELDKIKIYGIGLDLIKKAYNMK